MPRPKPTSKKTPVRKASTRPVSVITLVDPVLKRRWDDACRRINAAAHGEAQDFDQKWEAVAEVINADPPLYLAGGFSNDKDFFEKYLHADRVTSLRKARVAQFASPGEIETYGDTRIDALLSYLEAKAGAPLHGKLPVALDKVRIPVTTKGQKTSLSLADASRDQIRAATRAVAGEHATRIKASPRARVVQAALAGSGLKAVSVTPHREGFDLRGIPWDLAPKLGQALAKLKLPATPAPTPKP